MGEKEVGSATDGLHFRVAHMPRINNASLQTV